MENNPSFHEAPMMKKRTSKGELAYLQLVVTDMEQHFDMANDERIGSEADG